LSSPTSAESGPATTPATQPTTGSRPSEPIGPLPAAKTLAEGLSLTKTEKTILAAVDESRNQLEEEGLYMLLRRTAALPKLSRDDMDRLTCPTTDLLRKSPAAFRAEPMRMTVIVFEVRKLTGKGLGSPAPWWPSDRPVWWINCLNANAERPGSDPLIVLSVVDPMPLLGKPEAVLSDGMMQWSLPGKKVEVAGVFYRVYTRENRGDDKNAPKDWPYPVILTWQIEPYRGLETSSWFEGKTLIIVGLFLIVGCGWIYLRRRTSRSRSAPMLSGYHSLRDRDREEAKAAENASLGEVDPELRSAAEEYRKRRRAKDVQNPPS
jgi:hypothetical protein